MLEPLAEAGTATGSRSGKAVGAVRRICHELRGLESAVFALDADNARMRVRLLARKVLAGGHLAGRKGRRRMQQVIGAWRLALQEGTHRAQLEGIAQREQMDLEAYGARVLALEAEAAELRENCESLRVDAIEEVYRLQAAREAPARRVARLEAMVAGMEEAAGRLATACEAPSCECFTSVDGGLIKAAAHAATTEVWAPTETATALRKAALAAADAAVVEEALLSVPIPDNGRHGRSPKPAAVLPRSTAEGAPEWWLRATPPRAAHARAGTT